MLEGSPVDTSKYTHKYWFFYSVFSRPHTLTIQNSSLLTTTLQPCPPRAFCRYLKSICRWFAAGWHTKAFCGSPWSLGTPIQAHPAHPPGAGWHKATLANWIKSPMPVTPIGAQTNLRSLDVLLPHYFFTTCLHLRAEKFHSTGHEVSIQVLIVFSYQSINSSL